MPRRNNKGGFSNAKTNPRVTNNIGDSNKRFSKKNTKVTSEKKINTSKTSATDIFQIFSKNETELKLAAAELGANTGDITLSPHNYTKIHDIDIYPIIGTVVDVKSVLSGGKSKVGSMLARFKNQLQFPTSLDNNQLLTLAQNASVNMGKVAELAPMISHKCVKVNVNGVRPFYVPLLPMSSLGFTSGSKQDQRLPIAGVTKYATEDFIDKNIEKMFLPLLDNEGTEFDINYLYIKFKRIAQKDNNNTSDLPVKVGNTISNDAVNALGYMQQFLDKYLASVDQVFTRINVLTKVAEHVRHWSRENNVVVNDMFAYALNSTTFRGAIASLLDSRIILRSRKTLNKNHSGELFSLSKATSGRTTAMDIVSTVYFNYVNKSNNLINDPHCNWQFNRGNIGFEHLPTYEWSSTNNAHQVTHEVDLVCDVVIAREGSSQEVNYITVAQQQTWVNNLLKLYSLLEPTNIPWSIMSRADWIDWRNQIITAVGNVKNDLILFNKLFSPFYQVLSRAESYGLDTGYTTSVDENYNVVMSTAITNFSGSQTIKILNDLAKATVVQDPSDGSTVETYHNQLLYNSLISESAIQYFTGEEGLYYPFYIISKPTAFVTGNAGVGYKMLNNVTNVMVNKPSLPERQSKISLITYSDNNSKYNEQRWNADFSAVNLFTNYSSKIQIHIDEHTNNIVWDSTTFCTVDYHVDSLYNDVIKLISEAGLKQIK